MAAAQNQFSTGLLYFAAVFFAIWWAWLNFTWFASAYDNDDVGYRLLTILQILGSLVLAAGVPRTETGDFSRGVAGYVLMRVALIGQWLRAAHADPAHRFSCRRYALGVALAQCYWVAFLLVPRLLQPACFVIGVGLELAVPVLSERVGRTTWHPNHIAERYGGFFIIVLGEVVLSTTVAIQGALDSGVTKELAPVVVGGVLTVFSLWWVYFSREASVVLHRRYPEIRIAYAWGFGHYVIFAAGAALGAGLATRIDFRKGDADIPALGSAALVTGPVAVLLAAIWLLHLRLHDPGPRCWLPFASAVLLIAAATFTPAPELVTGVVCALLVVAQVRLIDLDRCHLR